MFCRDPQTREVRRVNKSDESLKTKKTHVQYSKTKRATGLDKLFLLQNDLFKEGLDLNEYINYVTDKVNKKHYYYNGLNSDNIDTLKGRYGNLIEKENNTYNQRGGEMKLNRKRISQFREKKRNMIYRKRMELIGSLLKTMKSSNALGVLRNTELLSDDPNNWSNTKKSIFSGGRYIETQDKKWVEIYSKLVSPSTYHLFNLHSLKELDQYVFEN
tara:strand:- start:1658 stop:2302 length:645 start_codon:yes stop_codon:yes gene_type:complete